MATIPETTTTVQYTETLRLALQRDTTLRQLAAQARTRYAGEAARIDRGLVIALNQGVTLHADGSADVQSCSNAEVAYHVHQGVCDCPDAVRAPEGRCKHVWARCLTRKAQKQDAAQTYYATYYAPDGAWHQGTAQAVSGRGWLFVPEDGGDVLYASAEALVLGGRVDILEGQRVTDGDLVRKVCGY